MAKCERCGRKFPDVPTALVHAAKAHGMTRQQAQSERKLHGKRR